MCITYFQANLESGLNGMGNGRNIGSAIKKAPRIRVVFGVM